MKTGNKCRRKHNHVEGPLIDYYSHISGMKKVNPMLKVVFSFLVLILCIVLNNPFVSLVVIITTSIVTLIKGKIPFIAYLRILLIPIVFILLGTLAIGIEFSKQPLGDYNVNLGFAYIYTSLNKIKEMMYLILRVFAAICALQLTTLSTPSSEFISVLRKLGMPKLIAELMHLIYRFIFILTDVFIKMKNSADSRQGYSNFRSSCFTFGNIASNMLIISLKRASTYYDAMEARCYDGDLCFLEEKKQIKIQQIIYSIVFITGIIFIWIIT